MKNSGRSAWRAMAAAYLAGSLLLAPAAAQAQRRMAPIPADTLTGEQKAAMQHYQDTRGRPLTGHLFMDLLRVPDAMIAALRMREHVQHRNLFGDKLTEFALLITLREWQQKQEWSGHAFIAKRVGLEAEVLTALAEGRYPRGMSDEESIIYDFTTELHRTRGVSDVTYDRMVRRFGEEGVIEAITIASLYTMVGMTLNTVREPVPAKYNELPDLPQLRPLPPGIYDNPVAQMDPPPPATPFRPTPPPP